MTKLKKKNIHHTRLRHIPCKTVRANWHGRTFWKRRGSLDPRHRDGCVVYLPSVRRRVNVVGREQNVIITIIVMIYENELIRAI